MKKTFTLLTQFNKKELLAMKKKQVPMLSPKVKNFIEQSSQDVAEYLTLGENSIKKRAEKPENIISKLKDNDQLLKKSSLEKINLLYQSLLDYQSNDLETTKKIQQTTALLVTIFQGLDNEVKKRNTFKTRYYVSDYHDLLINKLAKENISVTANRSLTIPDTKTLSAKQTKLIKRYEAIAQLHEQIQGKSYLDEEMLEQARATLKICKENQPDWSERSFIQKLTDILSLGINPIYRSFFAQEALISKEIEKNMPSAKL